ncbi:MAG TPA: helix-turn-helix domain-containing protein [Candidatus Thermoplasmatota archaeon]|nr:helix-turn-helix domain-containing protein [Candidatus Thermoplasmatota archaeon]
MGRPRVVRDEDILAATARVVSARGPVAFTLAEVAAEAGVSAPLLLQRFKTKRGLLLALADSGAGAVERAFAGAADADDALEALHAALLRLAGEPTPRAVANGLAFLALDVTEPDFRQRALRFFQAFHAGVKGLLDEAVRARELKPTDTAALARAVEVAYNGALIAWAIRQDEKFARALRDAVEHLLAPLRPTTRRG